MRANLARPAAPRAVDDLAPGSPRQEYWAPRRLSGRAAAHLIEQLDPEREDAEIAHLSLEVLTPSWAGLLGYALGAARPNASPRIAERQVRQGSGDQILYPRERIADTLTFFSELMRRGHRSAAGKAICDRINAIHRAVTRVLNEDKVFILSQLIFGPEIFGRVFDVQPFSDRALDGQFHFWLGVGRAMGLRGLPETRLEFAAWTRDYEARRFEPSSDGHLAAEGYIRGVESWFPGPSKRMVRSVFLASMDEPMRECLGYEPVSRATTAAWRLQVRSLYATAPVRPVRLDSTWTRAFSRRGPDPDLNDIGYGTSERMSERPARSSARRRRWTFSRQVFSG